MKKLYIILLLLVVVAGVVGAAVSVAMLVRAVQWSEWGRVIFYSFIIALCVEMTVLSISRLRNQEDT